MFAPLAFLLGAALAAALVYPRKRPDTRAAAEKWPPLVDTIKVRVEYSGKSSNPTITVDPWVAGLANGSAVSWTFESGDNADTLLIVPNSPNDWPFTKQPPSKPSRPTRPADPTKPEKPIDGGNVNRPPGPRVFKYSIRLALRPKSGSRTRSPVVIDPDIIIRE